MLIDHPPVVVGRERGEPLGQQVVERVARLDLDHLALGAEVLHVVDQQQLHAARDVAKLQGRQH